MWNVNGETETEKEREKKRERQSAMVSSILGENRRGDRLRYTGHRYNFQKMRKRNLKHRN